MKLLNKLRKYFESTSRPIYNPYDYPHIKYSLQDLLEGDTVGDLITEYQGIPSRLRRRTGQLKIDPIISSILPILKNRDIEIKGISNFLSHHSGSTMVFYIRVDDSDEFPPDDIIQYYEQYIGRSLRKLRDEYKLKYNLPPGCRLFLYNFRVDKVDSIVFNDSPISLSESSRNYRLTGTQAFETIKVAQISLEIETNI